jgi:hypothetical protein
MAHWGRSSERTDVASSIEQAALAALVVELFVGPPADGCIWIVVCQRPDEIVLAVDEQSFEGRLAGCLVSKVQRRIQHAARVIRIEVIDCAHGARHYSGRVARWQ